MRYSFLTFYKNQVYKLLSGMFFLAELLAPQFIFSLSSFEEKKKRKKIVVLTVRP